MRSLLLSQMVGGATNSSELDNEAFCLYICRVLLLYIDPGSGAIFAQVLAAMAGGFILFKNHIIGWFRSAFSKKSKGDK